MLFPRNLRRKGTPYPQKKGTSGLLTAAPEEDLFTIGPTEEMRRAARKGKKSSGRGKAST